MSKSLTVMAQPQSLFVPAIIAREDKRAAERFIDFFAVSIRNRNTRKAYMRAITQFLTWCEYNRSGLREITPFLVAAYIGEQKKVGEM